MFYIRWVIVIINALNNIELLYMDSLDTLSDTRVFIYQVLLLNAARNILTGQLTGNKCLIRGSLYVNENRQGRLDIETLDDKTIICYHYLSRY